MYSTLPRGPLAQPSGTTASQPAIKQVRSLLIRPGRGRLQFGNKVFVFMTFLFDVPPVEPHEKLPDGDEQRAADGLDERQHDGMSEYWSVVEEGTRSQVGRAGGGVVGRRWE